jgi:DNA-binding phage protein
VRGKVTFSAFDVRDDFDNEKVIAEYLALAEKEDNPDALPKAKADAAKARFRNQCKIPK